MLGGFLAFAEGSVTPRANPLERLGSHDYIGSCPQGALSQLCHQ
jgi:hypothetical protein